MTHQQFNEITAWQKETFAKATPISKLIHLAGEEPQGEIGELMEAIKAEDGQDYNKTIATNSEFADCFFLLFGAASAHGMNYNDIVLAIQEKFEINRKRNWGKPDANGVVNHIKTSTPMENNHLTDFEEEKNTSKDLINALRVGVVIGVLLAMAINLIIKSL